MKVYKETALLILNIRQGNSLERPSKALSFNCLFVGISNKTRVKFPIVAKYQNYWLFSNINAIKKTEKFFAKPLKYVLKYATYLMIKISSFAGDVNIDTKNAYIGVFPTMEKSKRLSCVKNILNLYSLITQWNIWWPILCCY